MCMIRGPGRDNSSSKFDGRKYEPLHKILGEHSGSVVECLTRDQEALGSSLTRVTAY